jgi:hypothetical protein
VLSTLQLGLGFFEEGGQGSRIGHVAKSFVRGFGVGTSVKRGWIVRVVRKNRIRGRYVDEKVKITQMKEREVSRW